VLAWTARNLAQRGIDGARLDAELLISQALGLRRIDLYVRHDQPLTAPELARIRALVERRRGFEPVAYILGQRDFYGRTFQVDPRVLIPRPETEGVVDAALRVLPPPAEGVHPRVLDLGAGSGVIALTMALERQDVTVVAVELSPAAAEVTRLNRARWKVEDRVELREGSLYKPAAGERFAVIVSNPPYIPSAEVDALMPDVARYEPRLALDGGEDGTTVLSPLVLGAPAHLDPGGALVVELGWDQAPRARELATRAGFARVTVERDLSKIERVLVAVLPTIGAPGPEPL
jgi:release factor glutamine methyltransferase